MFSIFKILSLKMKLSKGNLDQKNREKMQRLLENTSRGWPIFWFLLGAGVATFLFVNSIMDPAIINFQDTFKELDKPMLIIIFLSSVGVAILALWAIFVRTSIINNAFRVLTENSVKNINKQLDERNLLDKKIIITNISNGKSLGFTRDATIVGVIPQKRRFVIFELFIEFWEVQGKTYPIFIDEQLNIVDIDAAAISGINGFHQRGDLVPTVIIKKLESLQENKSLLIEYSIALDEIIVPDNYTIFELCTPSGNMQFRSYRFKEILYAVYPKVVREGAEDKIIEENIQLREKLEKYKKKIIDLS